MRFIQLLGFSLCFGLLAGCAAAAEVPHKESFPGRAWKQLPRKQRAGWSYPKLALAKHYAESLHDSCVMVVQGGRVVDEWGESAKKITTYSVRKSLLSALYGIYAAENVMDLNETLADAGIDDQPLPLKVEERRARIVDLCERGRAFTMRSILKRTISGRTVPLVAAMLPVASGSTTTGTSMPWGPFSKRRRA